MEKPNRGQFKRRFANAVGRLPFPGRHTVGPAAVRALRTPDVALKEYDRRLISRFRMANSMIGVCGVSTISHDVILMGDDSQPVPEAYAVPMTLGSVVMAASFASAYAQSYLMDRIDRSIAAAQNAPYEVGIDCMPEPPETVYREQRWPAAVETRDNIIHGVVFFGWIASNLGATLLNAVSQ